MLSKTLMNPMSEFVSEAETTLRVVSHSFMVNTTCYKSAANAIWSLKHAPPGPANQWQRLDYLSKQLVGPILDDRLKEKLLKPRKGAHSSHFRVCPSVRGLQGTLFGLGT